MVGREPYRTKHKIMKKIFFLLSIMSLLVIQHCFSQEVTEAWLTEQFGERFISIKESAPEDSDVQFIKENLQTSLKMLTKENLQYDRNSWIMAIEIDGIPQYKLIQALYSPNPYAKYDTLSLRETKEVIRIATKTGRAFPNSERIRFFLTKDRVILNHAEDFTFRLVLACDGQNYSVVTLPVNTQLASWDNSLYLAGINGASDVIILGTGKPGSNKIGKVMTLVSLTSKN